MNDCTRKCSVKFKELRTTNAALKEQLEIETMAHAESVRAHLFYMGRSGQFQSRVEAAEARALELQAQLAGKDEAFERARLYIRNCDHRKDHACVQCLPFSDMIIPGFVCAWHEAHATPPPSPEPTATGQLLNEWTKPDCACGHPWDTHAPGKGPMLLACMDENGDDRGCPCKGYSKPTPAPKAEPAPAPDDSAGEWCRYHGRSLSDCNNGFGPGCPRPITGEIMSKPRRRKVTDKAWTQCLERVDFSVTQHYPRMVRCLRRGGHDGDHRFHSMAYLNDEEELGRAAIAASKKAGGRK